MFEQFIEDRKVLDELWFAQQANDLEVYSFLKNLPLPPM